MFEFAKLLATKLYNDLSGLLIDTQKTLKIRIFAPGWA